MTQLQHFLISFQISFQIPGGYMHGYMHGYVMAEDKDAAHRAANHMLDQAEQLGAITSRMPIIILETRLSSGWKTVRSIISKHDTEPAKHWKAVKNFHLTAWFMPENDPDSQRLMKLH
jgi:hypothetical protein